METATRSPEQQLRSACLELDRALRRGEPAAAERWLDELPDVRANPELAIELVFAEFVARRERGEDPSPDEWYARFPEWEERLRRLFLLLPTYTGPEQAPTFGGGSAPGPNIDTTTQSGYDLLGVIGEGGMGVVHKAVQRGTRRVVALKRLHVTEPGSRARLVAEAEAIARLQHPNIIQLFEIGEFEGKPFLSMEYVNGGSLDEYLNGTPLPAARSAALMVVLARAVHHAHAQGVLHRDLKPANVLLVLPPDHAERSEDPGPRTGTCAALPPTRSKARGGPPRDAVPKIGDFGLAKCLDSEGNLTRTGILVGTPAYMAPEQADAHRAREVGPACDIYGLGAILYECLVGRPPFRADTPLATVLQVRTEEPAAPRRVQPAVPRDLETICLKCLHKDPRRRYASAGALADDLQRYLDGKPVLARPAGAIERGVKWARRRPTLAALLVTVPVLVALGFSGVFWQWRATVGALRETQEEQKKTLRAHEATKAHLYLNQISLAWNELRSNSGGRAEALLRDTDPALRNWEWHYLQRHAQTDLFTLIGHNNEIQAIAWSPDGQLIASGSGHWSSGRDSEFKIWDARTGQLLRTITQEIGTVLTLAFSPDGTVLASGSHDRVVRLWNPRTGQLVKELPGHLNRVSRVVFSPDGKRLASASLDNTARIWDLETGKALHVLKGHKDNVFCLEFSPDGKVLVTGDRKHVARVWDPATGKLLRTETGPGDLRAASFSPDGAWLAFGTFQGAIWVWDLTQPSAKPVIHNPGAGSINCLCFHPDGRRLAWASSNGSIKVRDMRTNHDVLTFRGNHAAARVVAFSPDGRSLVAGGSDHAIRIWDATVGEPTWLLDGTVNCAVSELIFEPDGGLTAVGGMRNEARIWDVTKKKTLRTETLPLATATISSAARSRDGRYYAWIATDDRLRLMDLPADRVICEQSVGPGPVTALAFSWDGNQYAWGAGDGTVRICEAASGRELGTIGSDPKGITGLAFHPNGRQLVTIASDATFSLWNLDTRELMAQFGRVARDAGHLLDTEPEPAKTSLVAITRLAFSPDGLRLAATNARRPLEIWDMTTCRVALTLDWDGMNIHSAAWSPDGRRLAIGRANTVRVLDTAEVSREARRKAATDQARNWHSGQARQCLNQHLGYSAKFHFDQLIKAEPNTAAHHAGRAKALAELEKWADAYAECTRAIELGDDGPFTTYLCAVLALQVGDHEGYKRIGARMLARHERSTDPATANNLAWTLSVVPGALENPGRIVALAKVAADKKPNTYIYENTLATALYRAGRLSEAADQFKKAMKLHELKQGNAYDWACLAMIYADMGKADQAVTWLNKATVAPPQATWENRIELRLLLAEADARVRAAKMKP